MYETDEDKVKEERRINRELHVVQFDYTPVLSSSGNTLIKSQCLSITRWLRYPSSINALYWLFISLLSFFLFCMFVVRCFALMLDSFHYYSIWQRLPKNKIKKKSCLGKADNCQAIAGQQGRLAVNATFNDCNIRDISDIFF